MKVFNIAAGISIIFLFVLLFGFTYMAEKDLCKDYNKAGFIGKMEFADCKLMLDNGEYVKPTIMKNINCDSLFYRTMDE